MFWIYIFMNKIIQNYQNYFSFLQPSGTPEGLLERRRALAALVLFVGRRYYLRPIIRPWNSWNSRRLLERALALLERRIAVTRVRVCDGNAMNVRWTCDASFLGPPKISDFWGEQRPWSPADLVERYRLCDSSAECECKITAFFWHGNGLSGMSWGLCPLTCTMLRRRSHLRKRSLSAGPPFLWFFSPYATLLRGFY